jgi:acetamidase/formamidase
MPPEIPVIHAAVRERGPGTHIITGPVHVRGATAGATLQIDIEDVELGAPFGFNVLHPLLGALQHVVDDLDLHVVPLDIERQRAEILPGIHVPVHPFFGILATSPPPGWGRISSKPPRAHGGNIDLTLLTSGATLYLPIHVDGANFSVGDGHARQGDGEVDGTAIETCMEGNLRLTVREDVELRLPLAVTPEHVVTLGLAPTLDEAARAALTGMIDLLGQECGLGRNESYRLLSMAADLRVTQVVNDVVGAHVMLERTIIDQIGGAPFFHRSADGAASKRHPGI